MVKTLKPPTVARETVEVSPEITAGLKLDWRQYQLRIASKAIAMFENRDCEENSRPANSVMIESPTGSGKTVMGLLIARWMQKHHRFSIGWVAMRRNLLAQAMQENLDREFGIDMKMISMFDKDPPQVDMLIVDEAQHDAANSMSNLHCKIAPKKVLGLSATPYRTDRMQLCFDRVIKDVGIHTLIQDGFLSRYRHFTIPKYDPQSVAKFFLEQRKRWGKSLIFFHRFEQCLECASLLHDQGVQCEVVTGSSNRERQLEDFDSNRVRVLINMNVLTEGFDCPSLKTVFCRPSGKPCTIQMGGRVLRRHARTGIKQIVQSVDSRHPFVKTAMADEQFVWTDGTWKSLTLNAEIAQISDRSRQLIASSKVELPRIVSVNRQRRTSWDRNIEDAE